MLSLPPLGTESDTAIRTLWVINPDETGEVKKRFEDLLGRGLQKRIRFLDQNPGLFEESIPFMRDELYPYFGVH